MDTVTRAYETAKVIATAVATFLVVLAAAVVELADEIAQVVPEGAEGMVAWLLRAAAVIGAAAELIRRHTPVGADQRGITGPSVHVIPVGHVWQTGTSSTITAPTDPHRTSAGPLPPE